MREAFVIVNPGARGGGQGVDRELRRRLPGAAVHRTDRPSHARVLARRAVLSGYPLVVAAGGDGTLNEVLNGIGPFLGQVRLGLLPLGTGNDFARSLGIPDDLDGALAVLEAGGVRHCDVGSFRDGRVRRLFLNVSAAGFSGEMGESLTPELKQSWGPLAYLRAALDTLPERTEYRLTLRFDDQDEVHESAVNLVVANGRYVASGVPIAPEARLDDGRFDVVLVRSGSLPSLAALASRVLLGRHLEEVDDRLLFRRARSLDVSAVPTMPLNVDGELLGQRSGRFEVLPGALEMVAGPDAPALSPQRPPEREAVEDTAGAGLLGRWTFGRGAPGSRLPGTRPRSAP
jgi:diacylglycerol kinase (ATP)